MKKNYTHVSLVLDRSGSMHSIKTDTIGSFNEFLKKQKEEEGECTFTLVQFSDEYLTTYDFVQLSDTVELTDKTYLAGGTTALLDAIGKTINSVGKKLDAMDEKDRPERNIFVVLTDGHENSSKEFKKTDINDMIKHQTDKYNWQFLFLGANQDAIAEAEQLGIMRGNTMTIAASGAGIESTMCSLDAAVTSYRNMSSECYASASANVDAFTDEDRKKQEEEIKANSGTKTP